MVPILAKPTNIPEVAKSGRLQARIMVVFKGKSWSPSGKNHGRNGREQALMEKGFVLFE